MTKGDRPIEPREPLGPLNAVLARFIVPADCREEYLGDLHEEWQLRCRERTDRHVAQYWYFRQLIGSAPAFLGWQLARANPVFKILLPLAIVLGLLFCYVDTRATWDDAGVMALAIATSAAFFAAIEPRRPWLWAVAVGLWIPLVEITLSHGFGSLIALAFAFAGAYVGSLGRHILARAT
jgi:hypothetical protein